MIFTELLGQIPTVLKAKKFFVDKRPMVPCFPGAEGQFSVVQSNSDGTVSLRYGEVPKSEMNTLISIEGSYPLNTYSLSSCEVVNKDNNTIFSTPV